MITEQSNNEPFDSGLAEELNQVFQYEHASTGQRFLNYLIDSLFIYFILNWVTGYIVGFLITKLAPELAYRIAFGEADQADIFFIFFLAFTLSDLLYYTFCEKVFKGYTLGKLITGSRAISADGSELTFKQAILRSLSRMVPFEPFSALGANPWHDSWTKTVVIKSR